jgi:hypothetical protein
MVRAGSGGRASQGWAKLSGVGNADERWTPVNGDRAYDRDKEQQQCERGRDRLLIEVSVELLDQDVSRHAQVGIGNCCVQTGSSRMVEVVENAVSHVHTRRRLVPIGTIVHVHGADPQDHQGYAQDPDE